MSDSYLMDTHWTTLTEGADAGWLPTVFVEDSNGFDGNYTLVEYGYTSFGFTYDEAYLYLQNADGFETNPAKLAKILFQDDRWVLYDGDDNEVTQHSTVTEDPLGSYENGTQVLSQPSPPPSSGSGSDSNQTYDSDDDVPTLLELLSETQTFKQENINALNAIKLLLEQQNASPDIDANVTQLATAPSPLPAPDVNSTVLTADVGDQNVTSYIEDRYFPMFQSRLDEWKYEIIEAFGLEDSFNFAETGTEDMPEFAITTINANGQELDVGLNLDDERFETAIAIGRVGLTGLVCFMIGVWFFNSVSRSMAR
tara:strand:+ start:837 stop:1769 length:933 start_codon:yes stop_codon:yes gene_type:complete